jgi:hypothetical protein
MDRSWIPGLTIGYEHTFVHATADFLKAVETGAPGEPTFRTALQTRRPASRSCDRRKIGSWVDTATAT